MLVFEKVIDNTLRKIVAMEKAWDVRESKTAAPLSSAGIEITACKLQSQYQLSSVGKGICIAIPFSASDPPLFYWRAK